jgi:hypothetical protein
MDNNPEMQPVNTPALNITKVETKENLFPEIIEYYVRDKNGQCFEVPGLTELWNHFTSDNGYRISFPVNGNKEITTIWRNIYRTPEEIAFINAEEQKFIQYCNDNAELIVQEDGKIIYQFADGNTFEFLQ